MPTEFTWSADPDSSRRRLDLLEQLLACCHEALGHKLRNQFITIGGMANALELELGERLNGKAREYLTSIINAVGKSGETVRALMELGRLGREQELSIRVELGEAVRLAATETKMLYPKRVIEYHLEEKMPAVNVPPRPLHLALVQLLRLAVDTAGGAGCIGVEIATETAAPGVALHIATKGRALAEDELALLFKRLCSGAVAADQGLDLFLVRQAAALWGGGVRLRAEPERGTTFTLMFAQTANK